MARPKAPKVKPLDTSNVTPASVTAETFPEGTPTEDDGTVASTGTLTISEARKVGALDPESAAKNRRNAKIIARKRNGEANVPWNEDNAIHMYDSAIQIFEHGSLYAYVDMIYPETVSFPPIKCGGIANSIMFDEVLRKRVHGANGPRGAATYQVSFKDATSAQFRGRAKVSYPSTLNESEPPMNGNGQPPYGMNPWGQWPGYPPPGVPPQGWGPPPGYPPPQQGGYPPAPAVAAPPPAPQPTQQVAPQSAPQPPQYAQPQQPQAPPQDPLLTAILQEMRANAERQQRLELQVGTALGAVDEFKRMRELYPQMQQPQPPAPQQQPLPAQVVAPQASPYFAAPPPPVQAPPPQMLPVMDSYGRQIGWQAAPAPGYPQAGPVRGQPVGMGAPPPPPPPPAAAPIDPMAQILSMASQVAAAVKGIDSIRAAVGAGGNGVPAIGPDEGEDDDTPAEPIVPPEMRRHPTQVGQAVFVTKSDGSMDGMATALANMHLLPDLLKKAGDGIASINQQAQIAQARRPITVQGVAAPQAPPPRVIEAAPVAPPPRVPPPPPARPGFIPNIDSLPTTR